jgi:hypothetical protein
MKLIPASPYAEIPLQDLRSGITAENRKALSAARKSLDHVKTCGEMLLALKDRVDHGQFKTEVIYLRINHRTATNYMKVASNWQRVSHLKTGMRDALAILTKGDPEPEAEATPLPPASEPPPPTTPKTKLPMGAVRMDAEEFHAPAPTEDEPEPLVVDEVKGKAPKWTPDDADRLWLLAKIDLDKILPTDKSRERVLMEVVEYSHARLKTGPMAIILQQLPKISEAERQELSARLESLTPQKP